MTIALKALLQQRHLHEYSEFVAEYSRRARELDLPRQAAPPTKAQYYRWVGGHIQQLPRGYHCLVLEHMFPGWTARQLFGHLENQHAPLGSGGLLSSIAPAMDPALLAGLWVTTFLFDGQHHVDLSTITVTNTGVAARNYPPEPRTEDHASGYANDIDAQVIGRHLIGQWRNVNDRYYYGSIHLAVLPGETLLDGYYTAILTDSQVVADKWRWVRVDPRSAEGVDLAAVRLREPRTLSDALARRTRFDRPIGLEDVTEDR
ncbi:MAG: hypothetical protein ACRDTK_00675 [Mycobacterium sp.]